MKLVLIEDIVVFPHYQKKKTNKKPESKAFKYLQKE